MSEARSTDGRYYAVQQGDVLLPEYQLGNFVVYDVSRDPWVAVWDRRSYEAQANPAAPAPPVPPAPVVPSPAVGAGRLVRVTDNRDGELLNRTYSYWANAWVPGVSAEYAYVFVGHADGQPRFYKVQLETGAVQRLGSLLGYGGTGEGWYWSRDGKIYLCDGPRLRRVDPLNENDQVQSLFSISDTHPGCRLWQAHSSADGKTHSATVQRIVDDGPYPKLGTVVFVNGQTRYFEARGVLDESQIDASGRFLLIKEDEANRIIDLVADTEARIENQDGALGHSDMGAGFAVGEDDQAGACVYLDLQTLARRPLFQTWGMGVVSVRGDRCLVSGKTHLSLVALDGSGVTHLIEHGMTGEGYDFACRANLSPCGRVASFLSNREGRMDAYVLVL